MKESNRILSYLRGDRRGKEANRLEREALNDAFLYEALEGYAGYRGDAVKELEGMSRKVRLRTQRRWLRRTVGLGVAVVFVAGMVGGGIWWREKRKVESLSDRVLCVEKIALPEQDFAEEVSEKVVPEKENLPVVSGSDRETRVSRRMAAVPEITALPGEAAIGHSVPVGGFEKFYQYIRDSLRYPEDALQQKREGDIRLSFVVNKAGRPSHIRVVKWITYSCNREAIRLLDKGPRWTYTGEGDTTYVVIPFRLKK